MMFSDRDTENDSDAEPAITPDLENISNHGFQTYCDDETEYFQEPPKETDNTSVVVTTEEVGDVMKSFEVSKSVSPYLSLGHAGQAMDRIVFHHDTVLSDVHLLLPNTCHLMARLNRVGQPVFISKFKILRDSQLPDATESVPISAEETLNEGVGEEVEARAKEREAIAVNEPSLDEDGDLEVMRRPGESLWERATRNKVCPIILSQSSALSDDEEEGVLEDKDNQGFGDVIKIEHTMATPLDDVGKQVWRGAFLLADYIFSQPSIFGGATVLELGAGTGLTSVVMATTATKVYCTDVGEDLLSMCHRNVTANRHLLEPLGGEIRIRQLDWLQHNLCTDTNVEFSWTKDEVADLHDNTSFIIAADICYDEDLTNGFFRTVYRLCSSFSRPCILYLSLEKRMNFTLRRMDVSCEAYDHFRHCLRQLEAMEDGRSSFMVERVPLTFPQWLQYERIEQLELWKVTSMPLQYHQGSSDSELPFSA